MEEHFENWLKTPAGQQFFSIEKERFANVSSMLCGSYGLQLTLANHCNLLSNLSVSSTVCVATQFIPSLDSSLKPEQRVNNIVLADGEALPFANKEFNVILAPHLVELCTNPQAVLREIYRVTAPEGLVLLTALNPYSLLAIQTRLFQKRYHFSPKVSLTRMKDWLSLLGFDIVAGNFFQYSALSSNTQSRASRLQESIGDRWLPMTAGAYLLVVRKRVFGQTLVGPHANKRYTNRHLIKPAFLRQTSKETRNIKTKVK